MASADQPPSVPDDPRRRLLLLGAGPLPTPESSRAPGVANRLWHFLRSALAAGHDCLVLTLEDDVPPLSDRRPEARTAGGFSWGHLAAGIDDFRAHRRLAPYVDEFKPHLLAGVGTLQPGATACALAGDRPVWVDLFGDPLAEIQAKATLLGDAFDADEHLAVWEMMLKVLMRADAFSTVSRRQRDALLGQLLLLGMTDGQAADAPLDAARAATLFSLIHPIPCCMESFQASRPRPTPDERAAWLEANGLPADAQVALWSGGFNAWADPATLVAGMELALARRPSLWLIVTGGPLPGYLTPVYDRMQRLVEASPHAERMRLAGWLPLEEADAWTAVADVGFLVDRPCAETRLGARNRLLGLARTRCPIVATRGTEVVEDLEAARSLAACDTGRPEALADALERVLADPDEAAAMAGRAWDYCTRHYRFDATCGPLLAFIERAGGSPAAGELDITARPAMPSAAEWIAAYADPERHRAEWSELARYRAGRLSRLRRWLAQRLG